MQDTSASTNGAAVLARAAMKAWEESDWAELRRIRQRLVMEPGGAFDQECRELVEAVTARMCVALEDPATAPAEPAVWLGLLEHAAAWLAMPAIPPEGPGGGRRASPRSGQYVQ